MQPTRQLLRLDNCIILQCMPKAMQFYICNIGPYTLVINVRGGASYFDILYHLSFIYIHKISILEVFIVGIAVDENYVRKQKAPLFTIYTHFQRCLLMKRICQITTATSFYNIYTFSEVLAVELLFVRTQK